MWLIHLTLKMIVPRRWLKPCISFSTYLAVLILGSIILNQVNSLGTKKLPTTAKPGKEKAGGNNVPNNNLPTCGMTYNLTKTKSLEFSSPDFGKSQYPASLKCNWTAVGSSECKPSISCKTIDLRETADCTLDYLEIYDGVGGYNRFCSREKVVNLQSKGNTRYMFVNLVTSGDKKFKRKYKGVSCEVSCNKGKEVLPVPESPINEDPTCVCGMQGLKKGDRIVNGESAEFREFPWLVAIVLRGTRSPLCGASIINQRWVLCAAHCFASEDPIEAHMIEVLANAHVLNSTYSVDAQDVPLGQAGSTRGKGWELPVISDKDEKSLRLTVIRIVSHPLFSSNFDFDVALLELAKDIDFHQPDSPKPICLPKIEDLKNLYNKKNATVAGWGLSDETAGATTRQLQKLEVPIINQKECSSWISWDVTERMICAGYKDGRKDSCTGDSGGPLAVKDPTTHQWTQVGIVSWGEGCARQKSPGFYSRVTEFVQWIQANAWNGIWCSRKSKLNF